jgi:hypothetical protein
MTPISQIVLSFSPHTELDLQVAGRCKTYSLLIAISEGAAEIAASIIATLF